MHGTEANQIVKVYLSLQFLYQLVYKSFLKTEYRKQFLQNGI